MRKTSGIHVSRVAVLQLVEGLAPRRSAIGPSHASDRRQGCHSTRPSLKRDAQATGVDVVTHGRTSKDRYGNETGKKDTEY
jgi:hypothetical protein